MTQARSETVLPMAFSGILGKGELFFMAFTELVGFRLSLPRCLHIRSTYLSGDVLISWFIHSNTQCILSVNCMSCSKLAAGDVALNKAWGVSSVNLQFC